MVQPSGGGAGKAGQGSGFQSSLLWQTLLHRGRGGGGGGCTLGEFRSRPDAKRLRSRGQNTKRKHLETQTSSTDQVIQVRRSRSATRGGLNYEASPRCRALPRPTARHSLNGEVIKTAKETQDGDNKRRTSSDCVNSTFSQLLLSHPIRRSGLLHVWHKPPVEPLVEFFPPGRVSINRRICLLTSRSAGQTPKGPICEATATVTSFNADVPSPACQCVDDALCENQTGQ